MRTRGLSAHSWCSVVTTTVNHPLSNDTPRCFKVAWREVSGLWGVVQGSQATARSPTSTGPPLPKLSCSYVSRSHFCCCC